MPMARQARELAAGSREGPPKDPPDATGSQPLTTTEHPEEANGEDDDD